MPAPIAPVGAGRCRPSPDRVPQGAPRGFYGVDLWRAAAATGADLLWRVGKDLVLPVVEQLPDGSYLTEIFDRSRLLPRRRRRANPRVIKRKVASWPLKCEGSGHS